jgi:hypothetical protein
MSVLGGLPAEEALIEADRWLLNRVGDFSSLPSVPLGFFDKLASYSRALVHCVGCFVKFTACPNRLIGQNHAEASGSDFLESRVGFMQLLLLESRQWHKVQRKRLLHRYLPNREMLSRLVEVESSAKVFRNSSPCLKAGVSLRLPDEPPHALDNL